MDESSFILLYKSMVRPHLEYANSVWCPHKLGDIREIEKVQKTWKWDLACKERKCGGTSASRDENGQVDVWR